MNQIYNLIVIIAAQLLKIIALFSPKMKLFVDGRKSVFQTLANKIQSSDKTIWFHAASLGEYEQGLPVIEAIKQQFPNHKIVVTFFSPSGYEVRKNNTVADVTVYLPLDTISNAKQFIELVHPEMAFFIKYEYWPNYLNELKKNNIEFKDGDTFTFKDNIFDYSEDKNIRKMAKLRHKMMKTMNKLVEKNNFKDKEIKFLG